MSIQTAIEEAVEAQAAYMEGTLSAADLYGVWGEVAVHAQSQADRMISYRDARIQSVQIVNVTWAIQSCVVERQGDRARATVGERWTYEANVSCASGDEHASSWVDVFPSEEYVLVQTTDGWRISSWLTGPVETDARWACP